MKRLLLVTVAVLALGTAACGKDKEVAATTTTSVAITTTTTIKPAATPTTIKKTTTTTAKQQTDTRIPADSQTPAAGGCGAAAGGYADIKLNPDVPSPRCIVVHDTDHLRVTNTFDVNVTVDDGGGGFTLKPGETYAVMKAVGGYWQPGVHRLKITNTATKAALYGGSGPEVWFKE